MISDNLISWFSLSNPGYLHNLVWYYHVIYMDWSAVHNSNSPKLNNVLITYKFINSQPVKSKTIFFLEVTNCFLLDSWVYIIGIITKRLNMLQIYNFDYTVKPCIYVYCWFVILFPAFLLCWCIDKGFLILGCKGEVCREIVSFFSKCEHHRIHFILIIYIHIRTNILP